ncbi:MAG TPA: hypothetical protein VOA41_14230 [Candidatus Dormibacteraeota bacterium]|nr:hypothetical protein [Candidatus Dormibacteraeota bacterium]
MIKRVAMVMFVLVALIVLAGYGLAWASNDGSWTGQINDSMCGAKNVDAGCAKKCVEGHGAKYVFVDDKDNKVYTVEPQDKAATHAGHHVVVTGTIEGDTIKVASITMPKEKK